MEKTLYSVLGLQEDATTEAIKAAFENRRQLYEAKAAAGDAPAKASMQAAREAMLLLSDSNQRSSYDARLRQRRLAAAEAEQAEPITKWIVAALLLLTVAGAFSMYRTNQETQRVEEEARLQQLQAEETARRRAEEVSERDALYAERKAANDEEQRLRREKAWIESTRREGNEISRRNERAEEAARREEQIARQKAEYEVRQREAARAREDAAAQRRLEEEKRKLRELERVNRSL